MHAIIASKLKPTATLPYMIASSCDISNNIDTITWLAIELVAAHC